MAATRPSTQLSSLYVSLALLGIAALASAAASSLFSGLRGTAGQGVGLDWWQVPWSLTAGIASAGWGLTALACGLVSFRQGC